MEGNGLLVKVMAFIAVVITAGWFISFVVMPAARPDFQPPNEVTVAMTAIITAIAGLLGGAYFKARRAADENTEDTEDGPDGDGNGQ